MKKCIKVTCPKCNFEFEACCIDYREELDWFAHCPNCDHHFPVKA